MSRLSNRLGLASTFLAAAVMVAATQAQDERGGGRGVAKDFAVVDQAVVDQAVVDQAMAGSAADLQAADFPVADSRVADLPAVVFAAVHQEVPVDSRPRTCFVDSTRTATA
ncbi:MAG: hypothetical protein HYV60_22520 [Planctomycetia bacterium]|nr:hypothetical protein [Planctomycetia bacterium]